MTQSYVEVTEAPRSIRSERAQQAVLTREPPKPEPVTRAVERVGTRGFMLALWSSVLLFVVGVVSIYHSAFPDGGVLFMFGSASIVIAIALLLSARARLLARFERDFQAKGASETDARQRALMLLEDMMGARKSVPPDPSAGHVVDRLPLS